MPDPCAAAAGASATTSSSSTAEAYAPTRRVGVAADEEQVVGAGLRHRGQDPVEMIAVGDHPCGDVDGHVVAHLAQLRGHLHGAVGPVLGRAGDRQAYLLGQLGGLLLRLRAKGRTSKRARTLIEGTICASIGQSLSDGLGHRHSQRFRFLLPFGWVSTAIVIGAAGPPAGNAVMVMTLSGARHFPSAAYSVLPTGATSFGPVTVAAAGSGSYDPAATRWGDYSWAVLDPSGNSVWMATEYIPPKASQTPDGLRNWGTRVLDLASH